MLYPPILFKSRMILLAGSTGSGKSTLAQTMGLKLRCLVISLDRYFLNENDVEVANGWPEERIWDAPQAIDWNQLRADVVGLLKMRTVHIPIYCLTGNKRIGSEPVKLRTRKLIIEGVLALYATRLRLPYLAKTLRLYVEIPTRARLRRVRERDATQRAKPLTAGRLAVIQQCERRWVLPQRALAHFRLVRSFINQNELQWERTNKELYQ